MKAHPSISVIIPVKNGAATLAACLQSVREQSVPVSEIIVLDSGSKDGSKAIAEEFGARIIDIAPQQFNHGLTRNEGARFATSDLLLYTVQDARFADGGMLARMVSHIDNSGAMAVTGHQAISHDSDKNPVYWFQRYSEPKPDIRQTNRHIFEQLRAKEKQQLIAWDNVIALYRKDALLGLPFVDTQFAEDWIWSYQALLQGWKLVYDPSVIVYHYHHRTFTYSFRLAYTINYHMFVFFGFKPLVPHLVQKTARAFFALVRKPDISVFHKVYWVLHNAASNFGQWLSVITFYLLRMFGMPGLNFGFRLFCKQVPQGKLKSQEYIKEKAPHVEASS